LTDRQTPIQVLTRTNNKELFETRLIRPNHTAQCCELIDLAQDSTTVNCLYVS